MTLTYQQQYVVDGLAGRAAILNLTARHNRLYSAGDLAGWIATFRHSGATYTRAGETFTDLRAAFDGGDGRRLVTVDHEIAVDGVDATQRCVALLYSGGVLRGTGTYCDRLVYERGGWYFASRELEWDAV
ncbi:MAG: nuclear transport factor 2 family protein [Candidatus Sericytochromatia bacterium]